MIINKQEEGFVPGQGVILAKKLKSAKFHSLSPIRGSYSETIEFLRSELIVCPPYRGVIPIEVKILTQTLVCPPHGGVILKQ